MRRATKSFRSKDIVVIATKSNVITAIEYYSLLEAYKEISNTIYNRYLDNIR